MMRSDLARGAARCLAALCVSASVAGCGATLGTLSGNVTYEGVPIDSGMVTLLPANGEGPAAAGTIVKGTYQVTELTPGPKIAEITAVKEVPFARSSEEMQRRYESSKAKGNATGLIDPADVIPANAIGNNLTIEIKAGSQTHDFHLQPPAGKRR